VNKPPNEPAARGALTASPQQGPIPLSVSFTGNAGGVTYFGGVWLEFEDGSNIQLCPPGLGCRETTVSHTYTSPGTYTARLVGVGEGKSETLATAVINVSRGEQSHD
jgi:PKD repeat protein